MSNGVSDCSPSLGEILVAGSATEALYTRRVRVAIGVRWSETANQPTDGGVETQFGFAQAACHSLPNFAKQRGIMVHNFQISQNFKNS